jgi:hypothetical protein
VAGVGAPWPAKGELTGEGREWGRESERGRGRRGVEEEGREGRH